MLIRHNTRSAPNVLWAQRKNTLLLTVQLVDCPDPVIDLRPAGKVDYQGVKQSDSTVHGFDLELFGGINPEVSSGSPLVLLLCHAAASSLTTCVTVVSYCCNILHHLWYICVTLLQHPSLLVSQLFHAAARSLTTCVTVVSRFYNIR